MTTSPEHLAGLGCGDRFRLDVLMPEETNNAGPSSGLQKGEIEPSGHMFNLSTERVLCLLEEVNKADESSGLMEINAYELWALINEVLFRREVEAGTRKEDS